MSSYGVQPTGFVRKNLATILAEIEQQMVTEFGPGVIQTPQSPFGQLNGLLADAITELWEIGLQAYQARDPDQAESVNLDTLGRYRLVQRNGATDEAFRQRITNTGQARVDTQDMEAAVSSITGVTYVKVFVNGGGEIDENGVPAGGLSIAVIGGDDDAVANTIRTYLVPGTITYGNVALNSMIDGYCRSLYVVRPIDIPVTLNVRVHLSKDRNNCPTPSPTAIRNGLVTDWQIARENGDNVTFFAVRQLIESRHGGVEVVSISAERDGLGGEAFASIGFIEIASLSIENVTIEVI
ncbi:MULTISPECIES: hypothetical protein [unclassified Aurantimonas]|uniref:hypothetical protein n=1 Tax=unclassified Aurantimonas TaxID=2638230 RepID=UPI002E190D60|nr:MULTISPECIES: hypothetical protein [unclassified Aurantimonas]MEC5289366.1 hypothetical protein [Aurantimonas sp. C2-3-R2]MEC5410446.1 hypothetical protein [Aurantimonas sp. C2-4-R8]